MLLLGIDLGSSSVKVSVIDGATGRVAASASHPPSEMEIAVPEPGYAEQDPEQWWKSFTLALAACLEQTGKRGDAIGAVGISYQMHGLVALDSDNRVVRPAIIWCDSRAVELGERAFDKLGKDFCFHHLLNSPGNFTASRLAWVKENEPEVYGRIRKIMLPGDYLAMRLTGEIRTTFTGLSEGIFWDYLRNELSAELLEHYDISPDLLPPPVKSFSLQGQLTAGVAGELGLRPGIPVSFRAGDQPANAFALNVMQPGEVAATAGTSGVIYGITDKMQYDSRSRVNTFMHVNHSERHRRLGVLLCINGTGILYSWLRRTMGAGIDYPGMDRLAAAVDPGSDGLIMLPFGNGAERMLGNLFPGGSIHGLNYNIHRNGHLFRAALESIAFSFRFGLEIIKEMGINPPVIRAGEAGIFRSPLFREILASVTSTPIHLYNTDAAAGAARGAGVGTGYYDSPADAFRGVSLAGASDPDTGLAAIYEIKYLEWLDHLENQIYET